MNSSFEQSDSQLLIPVDVLHPQLFHNYEDRPRSDYNSFQKPVEQGQSGNMRFMYNKNAKMAVSNIMLQFMQQWKDNFCNILIEKNIVESMLKHCQKRKKKNPTILVDIILKRPWNQVRLITNEYKDYGQQIKRVSDLFSKAAKAKLFLNQDSVEYIVAHIMKKRTKNRDRKIQQATYISQYMERYCNMNPEQLITERTELIKKKYLKQDENFVKKRQIVMQVFEKLQRKMQAHQQRMQISLQECIYQYSYDDQ